MKKRIFLMSLCVGCWLWMGAALTTRISSYQTLDSIADINTPDTELVAATGFFVGAISGEIDLLSTYGSGKETFANAISLMLHVTDGADNDTVTQQVYGRCDGGPPQKIAQIVWKIGTAQVNATATNLWAETATITSDHATAITVSGDDTDNRVGCVTFDLTGYRYVKSYFTADTGNPTLVTCLYRVY